MRALLLVLATGCASEAWQGDFDGEFLVTSYASDLDTCDAVTPLAPQEPYIQFLQGRESRSLQWCDGQGDCSQFDRWLLTPAGDDLVAVEQAAVAVDAGPMAVVCSLQYYETRAERTTSDDVRIEWRAYHIDVPYDASCTTERAPEAVAARMCSSAMTLTGTVVRARS